MVTIYSRGGSGDFDLEISKSCPVCFGLQAITDENVLSKYSEDAGFGALGVIPEGVPLSLPQNEAGETGIHVLLRFNRIHEQASQGCSGCKLLYEGCLYYGKKRPDFEDIKARLFLEVRFTPGQTMQCSLYLGKAEYRRGQIIQFEFHIFSVVDRPTPWKFVLKAPSFPRYLLTDERQRCITSWINNCIQNHDKCKRPSFIPKRIIDLGDDENYFICLCDKFQQPCPYLALSHSWQISKANEAMTLKANVEERKKSIQQNGLSKTFRDFFQIARWLGIRYVWIDTFCIIQDSGEDWAEQAAMMGSIYEGAFVTVASHYEPSGSTEDGCFLHRDVLQEVPLVDARNQPFSMFIKLPYNHVTNMESLMSRAWCVQERLLSARILHCRPSEMVFECFSETHCECETLGFEVEDAYELRMPEKDISELFAASQQEEMDNLQDSNQARYWEHWQSIIALYTRSQLTQKTDRLPALSSLAQRMPRCVFGNYLAGIWTGDFHNQLLWSHNLNDHVLQPEEYVAPSFSWASLYGGNTRWYDTIPKNAPGQRARILGISAVPKTKDPMGSVESGVIHMRLRMIEGKVTSVDKETSKIRLAYTCKTALLYDCSAEADAVNVKPFLKDKEVYLGEIISGAGFSKFLIMVRMGSSSTFQRVGIGRFSREEGRARKHMERDAFHQCEEQTIDLV